MTCTTHHHACNCREQRIAVLIKAALDAAYEIKAISNIIDCVAHDEKIKLDGLNSRLYAACEALGPEPTQWPRLDRVLSFYVPRLTKTAEENNSGALEEETHL